MFYIDYARFCYHLGLVERGDRIVEELKKNQGNSQKVIDLELLRKVPVIEELCGLLEQNESSRSLWERLALKFEEAMKLF